MRRCEGDRTDGVRHLHEHVPPEALARREGPHGARDAPQRARVLELCDRAGWKYVWSVEHHFLEEYSHISASEIFLPYVAARTKRIHVGSAIYNITPPVNHPARMAERVAMLDHLSEGRFEFGTGRGSSSTEFKGFGIPDGDDDARMYDESLREILRMWRETKYSYEGKYFSMPERNVLPKPYSQPHPPLWVACGSPSTFEKAGRLGLGALCFSLGSPKDFEPLIKIYKDTIKHAEPVGDYVNDNVACVTALVCHEDGKQARQIALNMGSGYHTSLVFRYLDTFPRPAGVPVWPDRDRPISVQPSWTRSASAWPPPTMMSKFSMRLACQPGVRLAAQAGSVGLWLRASTVGGVRWNTYRRWADRPSGGMHCTPVAPVPTRPTRLSARRSMGALWDPPVYS